MPDNAGEDLAQDGNMKPVDGLILYTDPDHETAEIKNKRGTSEGFEVTGHGHFVTTPPFSSPVPAGAPQEREVDIRERGPVIITVENDQDGAVTFELLGRHSTGGTMFSLDDFGGSVAAGAVGEIVTLTDPWAFLVVRAQSDSGGQSGSVVVKVQEQT